MFLHSISINNVSCFSAKTAKQTTWMEFDTDDITSNINILIGPNNSGKTQFLQILQIIGNFYQTTQRPTSQFSGPQTISSIWKTSKIEQEMISGLPQFIDIEYDLHTKSVHSHHAKLSKDTIKQLLEKHVTLQESQKKDIHQNILDICNYWLGDNYLDNSNHSSGTKHIRYIMELCSECMGGGIILIDEPEIHLHPQLQQKLGLILEQISEQFGIQFFLSTHSSQFINQKNCMNVFRFYQSEKGNTRHNPGGFIGSESSLQQILTQNNMSKIFFSKKIILCEGDIDQIFLQRYLVHYQKIRGLKPYEIEVDFLPIAGKGSYDMRERFCKRWKIDALFIGDRDNLFETNLGLELQTAKHYFNQTNKSEKISKSAWYDGLIEWIHNNDIRLSQLIGEKISNLQSKGMHILQYGDIESYMGIKTKGIESTIHFCNFHFEKRLINPNFRKKQDELISIFDQIFASSKDVKIN